jgi:hypothetical protein
MLDHLRQRIVNTLESARVATLSTCGPAAIQADLLPCELIGTRLYLLVPRASDHLFNLESQPDVVVTNRCWQVRGRARAIWRHACPPRLHLIAHPEARWSQVVEVVPRQVQLRRAGQIGYYETIDVED